MVMESAGEGNSGTRMTLGTGKGAGGTWCRRRKKEGKEGGGKILDLLGHSFAASLAFGPSL